MLREYVELCFQQKLIRLVFATETLAVGVNMPARTVVFSQVDKPNDGPGKTGHRLLRPDEFWQMAGRHATLERQWKLLSLDLPTDPLPPPPVPSIPMQVVRAGEEWTKSDT